MRAYNETTFPIAIAIAMSPGLLASCSFNPARACTEIEDAPIVPLTSQSTTLVLEDPGVIQVIHGTGCSKKDNGNLLKVEQGVDLPSYVTRATVFLNGWNMHYVDTDHQVSYLATGLGKIQFERTRLDWQAFGNMREDEADEAFTWCYFFTVVGWNHNQIDAVVDHDDDLSFCAGDPGTTDNFYMSDNSQFDTALSAFRSFVQNDAFVDKKATTVLPRGFGMGFGNDNNILQVAYNLDHADAFIEHKVPYKKGGSEVVTNLPGGAQRVDDGHVSWLTYAILKDDDRRRDYAFGEVVSGLAGNDVGVVQPPFAILPKAQVDALVGSDDALVPVEITHVPYAYAIPMLTAWDVSFPQDEHVQDIGAWIDRLSYVKDPTTSFGTIHYQFHSRLNDKNHEPGHIGRHKVTVLGFKPVGAGGPGGGSGPILLQQPSAAPQTLQTAPPETAPTP